MALLDFLKNKKEADKAKERKQPKKVDMPAHAGKVSDAKEVKEAKVEKPVKVKSGKEGKFSYEVISEPHISEKSNILGEQNKYVFRVHNAANKPEIKKAVEGIYGVNVLAVKTINIPKKKRRLGKTEGFKKAYRKAIVTLKEGQKIELF